MDIEIDEIELAHRFADGEPLVYARRRMDWLMQPRQ
jgi:hypothetical protein